MTQTADVPLAAPYRRETNLPWLWANTLYVTKHGSHAYGTSTPESDKDYRGFCIPPKEYFLGYHQVFEQSEFHGDPDVTIYDLRKFFKLAADCNPNAIEIIFTDPSSVEYVEPHGLTSWMLDNRDLFLSKKAMYTFSGYAAAQMKRIKNHKRWLDSGIDHAPTRAEYGLAEMPVIPKNQREAVEAMVRKKVESWDVDFAELDDAARLNIIDRVTSALAEQQITSDAQWGAAARTYGLSEQFIEICKNERRYDAARKEWDSYCRWKETRNPKRAENEKKYGYDTKHGMHLVRLLRMGGEILRGEGVKVLRPDAEELLMIRNGGLPYEELVSYAEHLEAGLAQDYANSKLPRAPDHKKLDEVLMAVIDDFLF